MSLPRITRMILKRLTKPIEEPFLKHVPNRHMTYHQRPVAKGLEREVTSSFVQLLDQSNDRQVVLRDDPEVFSESLNNFSVVHFNRTKISETDPSALCEDGHMRVA